MNALRRLLDEAYATPGTMLPSRRDLVRVLRARYGLWTGHATVGRALHALESEGRVVRDGTSRKSGFSTPGGERTRGQVGQAPSQPPAPPRSASPQAPRRRGFTPIQLPATVAELRRLLDDVYPIPGTTLPSRRDLVAVLRARYGLSTSSDTVGAALQALESEGRVVRAGISRRSSYSTAGGERHGGRPKDVVQPSTPRRRGRPTTLPATVAALRRLLDDVYTTPGTKLPSAVELVDVLRRRYELVTSDTAVKKAINVLHGEHRVIKRGAGAWTPDGQPDRTADSPPPEPERLSGAAPGPVVVPGKPLLSPRGPGRGPGGGGAAPGGEPSGGSGRTPARDAGQAIKPGPPIDPPAGGPRGPVEPWEDIDIDVDDPMDPCLAVAQVTFGSPGTFRAWLTRDLTQLLTALADVTREPLMLDSQPVDSAVQDELGAGPASVITAVIARLTRRVLEDFDSDQAARRAQAAQHAATPSAPQPTPWPPDTDNATVLTSVAISAVMAIHHEPDANALDVDRWLEHELPIVYNALAQMMSSLTQALRWRSPSPIPS